MQCSLWVCVLKSCADAHLIEAHSGHIFFIVACKCKQANVIESYYATVIRICYYYY
jgi:hypothetical protein